MFSLDQQEEEGEFLTWEGQTGAQPTTSCFLVAGLSPFLPPFTALQADMVEKCHTSMTPPPLIPSGAFLGSLGNHTEDRLSSGLQSLKKLLYRPVFVSQSWLTAPFNISKKQRVVGRLGREGVGW